MIKELTRSHILFAHGNRVVKIYGEMLVPTPGFSDYLIYKRTIKCWEPPFENEAIDEATKEHILREIETEMAKIGRIVEVR